MMALLKARESRREQLLRCAKMVFAGKGYHAAGVADIIECAGVARGTFYLYFESKRQIFGCILEDLLTDIDSRIVVVDVTPGAPPPLEQLRDNLRRVLTLFLDDPHLVHILLHQAVGLDDDCRETLGAFYRRVQDRIEASLRYGAARGLVRPCDPGIASACIVGAVKEVIAQLKQDAAANYDVETAIDEIMAFGLRGVLET